MTVVELPDPDVVPRPGLSPSRADDFRQCGLKYRLRVIDKLPEAPNRAAVRGTVVHAALEALFGLPAGERSPDRAVRLAPAAWERVREVDASVADSIDDPDAFLAEVRALVTNYFDIEDPMSLAPESCELRLETTLADGTVVRGIVDRLDVAADGTLRVVDYKTGRAPGEKYEARALFQLKFYALALLRQRGIVPAELRLLYLADNQVLTYRPDEAELLRFERIVSAMWAAIRAATAAGDFQPNPGRSCSWCDYRSLCPAFGGTPPPYPGSTATDDRPA